ncbi:hypothetical protein C1645_795316, partial [Glomus cerebriforme]
TGIFFLSQYTFLCLYVHFSSSCSFNFVPSLTLTYLFLEMFFDFFICYYSQPVSFIIQRFYVSCCPFNHSPEC